VAATLKAHTHNNQNTRTEIRKNKQSSKAEKQQLGFECHIGVNSKQKHRHFTGNHAVSVMMVMMVN